MAEKINKDSLGYLGFDFQNRLINQVIVDRKFGYSIIEILNPNYFENEFLKIIVATIKDAHEEYQTIPDMNSLEARLLNEVNDEIRKKYVITSLRKIKEIETNDIIYVQDVAMKFCKQQELKKAIKEIGVIVEKGNLEDYDRSEGILRKAIEYGNTEDSSINVTDNIDDVLSDDFRKTIPTGISGLDEIMDGGLAPGELAVILAAFGVGKTTMMTKIANTAKDEGKNVLQIFFEDMPKVIQRKHLACWSGYDLNSLKYHKDELIQLNETKSKSDGVLMLHKFPSDGVTVPMITAFIRKKIAQGFRPDVLVLDYIDCVRPSEKIDDPNVAEGRVMRQFESMLAELEIAGWTAIQGNRSSIGATVVEANQIGGSIKKGQIGHFIVSIAKTLEQKEANTATMAILKSRFGRDGIIFEDIVFNNATIQIDMDKNNKGKTNSEMGSTKKVSDQQRLNALLGARKGANSELDNEEFDVVGSVPTADTDNNNDNNNDNTVK